MTISKDKLEIFRKQLVARRDVLKKELSAKTAQMIDDEETFADAVDQAAAETDRNIAVSMKNRDEGILTQIDGALRRIDNGAFGDCESCGESISEARLQAFPLTTLCIDCKAELESDEQRHPGRG